MAYQYVDAPADQSAVTDAIVAFAVANAGFTNEGIDGTIRRISKSGIYWAFGTGATFRGDQLIKVRMLDVLPTSSTWLTASGQAYAACLSTYLMSSGFAGLYLFTDGNAIHCVLEIVEGSFAHINLGSISEKYGVWTGNGEFLTAAMYNVYNSSYSSFGTAGCTYPLDGGYGSAYTDGYGSEYYATHYSQNAAFYDGAFYRVGAGNAAVSFGAVCVDSLNLYNSQLLLKGPSIYNNRVPLLPMYARIKNVDGNTIVMGEITNAKALNLEGLVDKTILENDWMVFPIKQKTSIYGGGGVSGNYGIAYKK